MNENLRKIRSLCDNYQFRGNSSNEFLFTLNCVDYFYFNKNMGQIDILDGFVDGAGDGGIDFIYNNSEKIYLIQGKSSTNLSYNDIRDVYTKILDTVHRINDKNTDNFSNKIVTIYKDKIETFDNPEINFVLFTNTELNEDIKKKVQDLSKESMFDNYNIILFGKEEIDNQVSNIDDGDILVKEGKLKLESANNYLEYGDGKGIIVTIKANSLKELYTRYSNKGLFGYNLREHVVQKNVDDAIEKTIKNEPQSFWFLNNGITIGCKDYSIDGNQLKLYDFSIINGAQTTTNIGKSLDVNEDKDFSLICKIVKSENSLADLFIRKISEASNSQKPIKFRDLKSNCSEQRELQSRARDAKYKLAIEIKRGVKPINYKNVESWQRVSNELIGQLLWACEYQCPGSARSKTSDIFGVEAVYNLIFSKKKIRDYDYATIYDLVRLSHFYDEFKIDYTANNFNKASVATNDFQKNELNNKIAMCRNGKLTCLAIICHLYKRIKLGLTDINDERLNDCNIKGEFSLGYENMEEYHKKLDDLFKFIIDKLSSMYSKYQTSLKVSSQSNFLKTDNIYHSVIRHEFNNMFEDEYDAEKIEKYMEIFY